MQKQRLFLALIFVLVIAAVTVISTIPVPLGLDLRGGSQLTIQVKTTPEIKEITERQLEAVQTVLGNRVNGLGVSEPVIQTVKPDKISIQLAGVSDPEQAERVLGGTAQLEFMTQKPETETQLFALRANRQQLKGLQAELRAAEDKDKAAIEKNQQDLKTNQEAIVELFQSLETPLTGKYLTNANPLPPQNNELWAVGLQFNTEGGKLFADLTKNLAGTGRSIGIFLDNELISNASVGIEYASTGIAGGNAQISGNFTAQEAQDLVVQLRGGSLPVPIEIVENRTVGATLGRDSIQPQCLRCYWWFSSSINIYGGLLQTTRNYC